MKENYSSRTKVVTSASAIALLLHPEEMIYLKPFMREARAAQDVAKQLELSMNFLYYRVKRFEKHGFLKEHHQEKRKGRAIKYYKSSVDAFFVPYQDAQSESLEQFIELNNAHWQPELTKGIAKAIHEAAQGCPLGLHISMDEKGMMLFKLDHHPDSQANKAAPQGIINVWETRYHLNDEDVEQMKLELAKVQKKYLAKCSGKRRVFRLAMAAWEA